MIDRRKPTAVERAGAALFWFLIVVAFAFCTALIMALLEVRAAEEEIRVLKAQIDSQWNELHMSRCQTQGGESFVEAGELKCFTRKGKLLWKEEWR